MDANRPHPPDTRGASPETPRKLPPLSPTARVLLLILGWLLILLGLAGLVLPGLQGVLTLIMGAAVLSLVSSAIHRWLRWAFRPWPWGWRQLLRMRRRVHAWLTGSSGRE